MLVGLNISVVSHYQFKYSLFHTLLIFVSLHSYTFDFVSMPHIQSLHIRITMQFLEIDMQLCYCKLCIIICVDQQEHFCEVDTFSIQMHPFKKHSKSIQKKGVVFEASPNEIGNLDDSNRMRPQTQTRTQTWTDNLDASLLCLLTEKHTLGNNVNGSFTNLALIRIVFEFNFKNNMNLTKDQIKKRLKVLKRCFIFNNCLANKSSQGQDYIHNIPLAGDSSDQDAIIAVN